MSPRQYKALLLVPIALTIGIISCRTHYPVAGSEVVVHHGSAERGRGLTMSMCAPCHYNESAQAFIGKEIIGLPRIAGKVYSSNLTQSVSHSTLAKYSDAALVYLIRTGIARDGHFIPYMMRPNIADKDAADIVAFLRSSDLLMTARDTAAGKTRLSMAGRLGQRLTMHPQPFRTGIARPSESDTIALGRYLVDNIGCFHCHSKSVFNVNYLHPEKTKGYLAGGAAFSTRDGKMRGPNILFDPTTGIGGYTREELRRVLQGAVAKDGHKLKAPAEVFPVSDAESDAIYAYLQSLPPVKHRVKGNGKR